MTLVISAFSYTAKTLISNSSNMCNKELYLNISNSTLYRLYKMSFYLFNAQILLIREHMPHKSPNDYWITALHFSLLMLQHQEARILVSLGISIFMLNVIINRTGEFNTGSSTISRNIFIEVAKSSSLFSISLLQL